MSIGEKDKSELLGLASGFGTSESDVRARLLAERDPEAATYLRQMQAIGDAFRPPADLGEERHLSPHEIDELTAAVLARAQRRPGESRSRRWLGRLGDKRVIGGIAAALALATCAPWVTLLLRSRHPPDSQVTEVLYVTDLREVGAKAHRKLKVLPGDPITTQAEFAKFSMRDGTVVVLDKATSVRIRRPAVLVLESGCVVASTREGARIELGAANADLESGIVLATRSARSLSWFVYEGSARIEVGGKVHTLTAGQRGSWNPEAATMEVLPHEQALPGWASSLLRIEAEP